MAEKRIAYRAKWAGTVLILLLIAAMTVGCDNGQIQVQPPPDLRFAVTPGIESLPLLVALEEGIFAESELKVDLVKVDDAAAVETLLRGGAVDGGLGSVFSLIQMHDQGLLAMATSTSGCDYILAVSAPLTESQDKLEGATVVASGGLVEQFLLEELLQDQDLKLEDVKVSFEKSPEMVLEKFSAGKADAVFLPRHLEEEALAAGAVVSASTLEAGLAGGIIIFSGEALQELEQQVIAFYQAYEQALALLQQAEGENLRVLKERYGVIETWSANRAKIFQEPRSLARDDVSSALAWLKAKENFAGSPVYEGLIWSIGER